MRSRPWWLAQLWVGAAMAGIAIATRIAVAIDPLAAVSSSTIPLAVTLYFFAPGLALSFGINGLLMAKRPSRHLGLGEFPLLMAEFVAAGLMLVAGFLSSQSQLQSLSLLVSLLVWIALLILALTLALLAIANWRAPTRPPVRRP